VIEHAPDVGTGLHHGPTLQGEPLVALDVETGVGHDGMGVELRIQRPAGVVEEQGTGDIAADADFFRAGEFSGAQTHGGEVFHLAHGHPHGFLECLGDAGVFTDNGDDARGLRRTEGDVVQRDGFALGQFPSDGMFGQVRLAVAGGEPFSSERMPVLAQGFEMLCIDGSMQPKVPRPFADPFPFDLLAFSVIVVGAEMPRQVSRAIGDGARSDHAVWVDRHLRGEITVRLRLK
jgi:hypothetical protein